MAFKEILNYGIIIMEYGITKCRNLGFNYRITDIQAALGISQLKRAEEGLKRRREIAEVYDKTFKGKPYIISQSGIVEGHAYHLYIIEVDDRKGLIYHLRDHNIIITGTLYTCSLDALLSKTWMERGRSLSSRKLLPSLP